MSVANLCLSSIITTSPPQASMIHPIGRRVMTLHAAPERAVEQRLGGIGIWSTTPASAPRALEYRTDDEWRHVRRQRLRHRAHHAGRRCHTCAGTATRQSSTLLPSPRPPVCPTAPCTRPARVVHAHNRYAPSGARYCEFSTVVGPYCSTKFAVSAFTFLDRPSVDSPTCGHLTCIPTRAAWAIVVSKVALRPRFREVRCPNAGWSRRWWRCSW
jgi:hypothetical protein